MTGTPGARIPRFISSWQIAILDSGFICNHMAMKIPTATLVLGSFLTALFILGSCSSATPPEELYAEARENGLVANEGYRRCLSFTEAWLEYADPVTGLFPENLYQGNDTWNAHNSAADNYPFMVLTTMLLDSGLYSNVMKSTLESERKLTSRIRSLPDDFSIRNRDFVREKIDTAKIIFGSSEYIKDGLLPLTEYSGHTGWTDRLIEMLDDLGEIVTVARGLEHNRTWSRVEDEINGELLQALSRIYWMTGNQIYLERAIAI